VVAEEVIAELARCSPRADITFDYVSFMTNTGHRAGQNLLANRTAETHRTGGERDVLVLLNPDT